MRADVDVGPEPRRRQTDPAALTEYDPGLMPSCRRDVDLGFVFAVADQEIVSRAGGHHGLPVLPRDAEPDFAVDAQAGLGVFRERLIPKLTLPIFEDERLARPAALGMDDVALEECRETIAGGGVDD